MEIRKHDVLVLGTGLAGLRAAVEVLKVSKDKLSVGIVSKVHLMRSHSVAPEGGAAAVLSENDSFDQHAYDTVKGSDFLADQDVVETYVRLFPKEILQLEHWGCPWSRNDDGSVAMRLFGAHDVPRTVFAEDRTGFFLMRTLYDTLLKFENFERYDEYLALSIIIDDREFRGLLTLEKSSGNYVLFESKALVIATGGLGRLWEFTTNAHTTTGDGFAIALRAGIPLKDMEFVQWLPTCMVPHGIPATEALRGHGAVLLNSKGERFMKHYAPSKMELAARDIVSRAMITEIREGRGFKGPEDMECVMLDARPVGEDKLMTIYKTFVENARDFIGIDPLEELVPVRPAAHFAMGGIDVDINLTTIIPGIYAAGEVACPGFDGANRLGSNSLPLCLATGRIAGQNAAVYAMRKNATSSSRVFQNAEREMEKFERLTQIKGSRNPYELKKELSHIMESYVGLFRDEAGLLKALERIRQLKISYLTDLSIDDSSKVFNTELTNAIEFGFMLDVAEVITLSALKREESRGAHYRTDFPKRDDEKWLKHSVVRITDAGLAVSYRPVKITKWKPEERRY
jgi:succinate dehydrogenase / fumarate reductase flavoprotein subunit